MSWKTSQTFRSAQCLQTSSGASVSADGLSVLTEIEQRAALNARVRRDGRRSTVLVHGVRQSVRTRAAQAGERCGTPVLVVMGTCYHGISAQDEGPWRAAHHTGHGGEENGGVTGHLAVLHLNQLLFASDGGLQWAGVKRPVVMATVSRISRWPSSWRTDRMLIVPVSCGWDRILHVSYSLMFVYIT